MAAHNSQPEETQGCLSPREGSLQKCSGAPDYLDTLNTAHGIREAQKSRKQANAPIWPISRVRVWQIVKGIMIEAGIPDAPHRSPKGLRHGFGINDTVNGIPLHMLQKWMGHAQLSTTAIYADAVGKEEQDIAAKMWN
ncbi:tyrosine-type recombinase/integrase [Pseudophaeobacter flagellatus]|uniref:tyrosine-type recombinase/integrase n=1 Tax=Pseudophaeobacter flagellatus TaxID=2899119 RepID=UPI001E2EA45D|nr:site-specific integrase [Pseudophaeobacter flagellatus]